MVIGGWDKSRRARWGGGGQSPVCLGRNRRRAFGGRHVESESSLRCKAGMGVVADWGIGVKTECL